MKTKFTLLTLLMLFVTSINFAQTSVQTSANASGIAIQGIARDDNNTARINTNISLIFDMYYIKKSDNSNVTIGSPITKNLQTDNFGVFSTVFDPGAAANSIIANNQVSLKISEGNTVISDEKLNHVPYAIAANNGVPTGCIMPFVGTTVPTGWVLCDGQSLAGVTGASDLIALIGNNAPDLKGMFLRGTGTNSAVGFNTIDNAGPALNTKQQDENLSHDHPDSFAIPDGGGHGHAYKEYTYAGNPNNSGKNVASGSSYGSFESIRYTEPGGVHSHTIDGVVLPRGGTESRPVNYGVNYIIKL